MAAPGRRALVAYQKYVLRANDELHTHQRRMPDENAGTSGMVSNGSCSGSCPCIKCGRVPQDNHVKFCDYCGTKREQVYFWSFLFGSIGLMD